MTVLITEAEIALADPGALAARLVEHLVEHGVTFETRDGSTVADLGKGTGTMTVRPGTLTVRVEAADDGDLEMLRSVMASHIVEFAPEPIAIRWSGFAGDGALFSNFRELRLVSAADVTPLLRRLTFAGADLARFASADDLHVRLYLPPPGLAVPEWPRLGADGRTLWPPDERRPALRYYTIRRVDPERGLVEIDFVRHVDGGPGAEFAETARPGAVVGMAGPVGRTIGPAAFHVLAGDETALPAIARVLEGLDSAARGRVLVEVAGPQEEIPLAAPPGVTVRWLHRNGAPAGAPDRLLPAVRDGVWPEDGDVFVWIGCEFALAKTLRRYVERERGLPKSRHLIVGYWTRERAG